MSLFFEFNYVLQDIRYLKFFGDFVIIYNQCISLILSWMFSDSMITKSINWNDLIFSFSSFYCKDNSLCLSICLSFIFWCFQQTAICSFVRSSKKSEWTTPTPKKAKKKISNEHFIFTGINLVLKQITSSIKGNFNGKYTSMMCT